MNINEVIKYPLLSEKTYAQMNDSVYTFVVDTRTNRAEVKKVVEFIFDVKVKNVNIMNYDKKPKKLGKFQGFTNKIKKAVITLSEGQINIFPEEVEESKETTKKVASEKPANKEISEAEQKAADKIAAKLKAKETETKAPAKEEVKTETKTDTETKAPAKEEVKTETKTDETTK